MNSLSLRRRQCLTLLGLAALPAHAANPRALLTISGKTGSGLPAQFDLAALQRLPQHSFTTHTPWVPGPQKFTGPLLRDLLKQVESRGTVLQASALNDYRIAIPASDAKQYDVVVAHLIDDKPIAVRERGPLFVIYPFDQWPQLRNTRYYQRSIWQLKAIVLE
ncbi:hypothetical protein [Ramlibacter tataouinensis]|uniref:Oxidoreductase molybdopterin-binding domain-containing protein n=1 Tax=Ramlibacter tataouinensis (strain ATCC BAA-407 / DSM 14655 / LMG 21543 / TTB310) TaxID=365046 RepID=F5XVN1_RAMTT|nr:hypothetical protein [Ramlibacter tataouinensis]AEG91607.1 Conserved hypothetical protein [Ramlibacter tataouinensis TTB310]